MLELFIFSKVIPNNSRPLPWELLRDKDQVPVFLGSQGRACHQPSQKCGFSERSSGFQSQQPALSRFHHLLVLLPAVQNHEPVKNKTKQNFGFFSLSLKWFIIEGENSAATLRT